MYEFADSPLGAGEKMGLPMASSSSLEVLREEEREVLPAQATSSRFSFALPSQEWILTSNSGQQGFKFLSGAPNAVFFYALKTIFIVHNGQGWDADGAKENQDNKKYLNWALALIREEA